MKHTLVRGYTLLEMIVAVGVFSIIMLAATGAYLTLISLDRHARATSDVVTNLSFAVDSMTRSVRTGTNYGCNAVPGSNCTSVPADSFSFRNVDGETIVYSLTSGRIRQTNNSTGFASDITDPRIAVTSLNFYVRGVGIEGAGVPDVQPQMTVTVEGTMTSGTGQAVDFTIQGGATQRLIEL